MDKQKKFQFSIKRIYGAIFTIAMIMAAALLASKAIYKNQKFNIIDFTDSFDTSINGEYIGRVSLLNPGTGFAKCGDILTFSNTIPDSEIVRSGKAMYEFRAKYTVAYVYIDDKIVDTFGEKEYKKFGYCGSITHFVELPADSIGKKITIVLEVTENKMFSAFSVSKIGSVEDIFSEIIYENIFQIFSGIFMVTFGLFIAVISIVMMIFGYDFLNIFFCALTSVAIGVWSLGYINVLQYVIRPSFIATSVEYISLYIIGALIPLIMLTINKSSSKNRKIYMPIFIVNTSFFIVATILHFTNIMHYNRVILIFYFITIFCFITVLVTLVIEARSQKDSFHNNLILAGLVMFFIFMFIDIILYSVNKYITYVKLTATGGFLSIGGISLIIAMMVNYYSYFLEALSKSKEQELLHKFKYTDRITGLPNRTSCMEFFKCCGKSNINYMVICFDIDHLKIVNTKYGIAAGDMMISHFAKKLQECFNVNVQQAVSDHTDANNDIFAGRMDSDEFIVIVKDKKIPMIPNMIDRLNHELNELTAIDKGLFYSMSYGMAAKSEGTDINKVYSEAFKRMEVMKTHS